MKVSTTMIKLKFILSLILIHFLFLTPLESRAEISVEEIKSWQRKYCVSSHLRKSSVSIKEEIGLKLKTNPNKVSLKRFNLSFDECLITAYTDKGPITCQILFGPSGKSDLTPCPINEEIGQMYADLRFAMLLMQIGIAQIDWFGPNRNDGYIDLFKGTDREGGL